MWKWFWFIVMLVVTFIVAAWVAPTYTNTNGPDAPGFWWGLVHGMVAGPAFILSWFNDTIGIYAKNNCGGWYDFGFLLGVGAFTVSSTDSKD